MNKHKRYMLLNVQSIYNIATNSPKTNLSEEAKLKLGEFLIKDALSKQRIEGVVHKSDDLANHKLFQPGFVINKDTFIYANDERMYNGISQIISDAEDTLFSRRAGPLSANKTKYIDMSQTDDPEMGSTVIRLRSLPKLEGLVVYYVNTEYLNPNLVNYLCLHFNAKDYHNVTFTSKY